MVFISAVLIYTCNILLAQRWLEKIIFVHNLSFNRSDQCLWSNLCRFTAILIHFPIYLKCPAANWLQYPCLHTLSVFLWGRIPVDHNLVHILLLLPLYVCLFVLDLGEIEGTVLGLLISQTRHTWSDDSQLYCTAFLKHTMLMKYLLSRMNYSINFQK